MLVVMAALAAALVSQQETQLEVQVLAHLLKEIVADTERIMVSSHTLVVLAAVILPLAVIPLHQELVGAVMP
jgi:hypothetical protein